MSCQSRDNYLSTGFILHNIPPLLLALVDVIQLELEAESSGSPSGQNVNYVGAAFIHGGLDEATQV